MKLIELIETTMLTETYIAYELDENSRKELHSKFPPKYDDFIGHHITYQFGVSSDTELPTNSEDINVIGYADDGESIEALVVEINGTTTRQDGKIYHITWSLDRSKGRKPVDSNKLISEMGWTTINPIKISADIKML